MTKSKKRTPRDKELEARKARARREKKERVSPAKPEQKVSPAKPEQKVSPAKPEMEPQDVSTFVETSPSPPTNAPESQALAEADQALFDKARTAIKSLKRTFEDFWLPIAKAVARAREIAVQQGGGKTFMRLLEQQELSAISKAKASKLEKIIKHLPEVEA